MIRFARALSLAPVVMIATLAGAHADPASDVAARHTYFDTVSAQMKVLGPIARNFDPAKAKSAAAALAPLLSTEFHTLFPADTAAGEVAGSRALASIWTEADAFAAREAGFKNAGQALVAAADAGDAKAYAQAFGEMGKSCKACHDSFRGK